MAKRWLVVLGAADERSSRANGAVLWTETDRGLRIARLDPEAAAGSEDS